MPEASSSSPLAIAAPADSWEGRPAPPPNAAGRDRLIGSAHGPRRPRWQRHSRPDPGEPALSEIQCGEDVVVECGACELEAEASAHILHGEVVRHDVTDDA